MEDNLNVADILKGAYEGSASKVEDAFNNVIQQKMADAIQTRREEIAQYREDETPYDLEDDNEDI